MTRFSSFFRPRGGVPPGAGERRGALVRMILTLTFCALAGTALLSPGSVFGAGDRVGNETAADSGCAKAISLSNSDSAAVGVGSGVKTVSQGTLLAKLPWGNGPGQVGLQAPLEGLARGPEAVAVAPDGRIAVLDSVNRRVVTLEASGSFSATIPLELAEPRFLAVTDGVIYVLDCDNDRRLASLDWSGALLGVSTLPEVDDVVTGLFATDAGPCVEAAHERTLLFGEGTVIDENAAGAVAAEVTAAHVTVARKAPAAEPRGTWKKPVEAKSKQVTGRPMGKKFGPAAKVSFKPGKAVEIELFKTDRKSMKSGKTGGFSSRVYDKKTIDHLVSVDDDGHGGLVIGARLLSDGAAAQGQSALVITRMSAALTAATVSAANAGGSVSAAPGQSLLLADCPFAYLGQPYVVAPDGRVLQPVADEGGYSLFVHEFNASPEVL